ncbi:MAG: zinc ribbon domain-containing protein [Clostridia bacterium]|nr:zinc ribbon domain-containing protein [Clostridia bacterium]
MESMRCPKCGKEILQGSKFCNECGATLIQESLPGKKQKKKQSGLSTASAILAILSCTSPIAFILGIIDLVKNDKDHKHGGSIFAIIYSILCMIVMFFVFVLALSDTASTNYELPDDISAYDSSITYDNLARNPDEYKGKYVLMTGEIVQLMESGSTAELRIAIDGDYDKMVYSKFDTSEMDSRILEGDKIKLYGVADGLYSYQSVLGSKVTLPYIYIQGIEQQ